MRKLEGARSPHRPTGLGFRSRAAPSPSTHPALGPLVTAFLEENEPSRPPRRGAGPLARPQSQLVSPERSGDVTRAGRAQPATLPTLRASLPPPLRAAGVYTCAPSRRRRHPTARRAPRSRGSRAGARARPPKAAFAYEPQLREPRYPGRGRARSGHAHREGRKAPARPRV